MYCYDEFSLAIFETLRFGLFSPEVPVLVYYSHMTAIIVSLVLSFFIFLNSKTLPARILVSIAVIFLCLSVLDILLWTLIDVRWLMFLWSFWLFLFITIYVLSFYFLYAFITNRDISFSLKLGAAAVLLAVLGISMSPLNLGSFDVGNCTAIEGINALNGVFALSLLIFIGAVVFGVRKAVTLSERIDKRKALLATTGVGFFLLSFSAAAYLASVANLVGSEPDTFKIEQYGYFGMTIFIALLAYTIVKYHAFNIKLIATQALVAALVILIGSQFFFIRNPINYSLNGITLALSLGFGYLLVKSVKREVEQRERIERLAKDLETANSQQIILIHFITHQLKGFVTKSRNLFSMILEGDYGQVPDELKPILEEGLRSDTKGVNTIQEILNAANIKSGKVTYAKVPLDLKELVGSVVTDLRPNADAKGVAVSVTSGDGDFTIQGDRMQLTNAIKNLIDNSIKYTLKGSVNMSLIRQDAKVRFEIKDTGVGITPEDMQLLFTEGGHGKESQKVNVESTGFGLYIVKNIVEAHGGEVWAESEGKDKGSRFIVELPA